MISIQSNRVKFANWCSDNLNTSCGVLQNYTLGPTSHYASSLLSYVNHDSDHHSGVVTSFSRWSFMIAWMDIRAILSHSILGCNYVNCTCEYNRLGNWMICYTIVGAYLEMESTCMYRSVNRWSA